MQGLSEHQLLLMLLAIAVLLGAARGAGEAARRLHQLRGTKGPVWQHQFWDRFVRHEKEYAARFDYMHLNPVRKGLVSKPGEWRWSSYNNFAL